MIKLCFIITDAISFNTLCKGQLEYFNNTNKFQIFLICGGSDLEIKKLKDRNIGNVIKIPFTRQPNVLNDFKCLIILSKYLILNRFDLVVYSTPKALLLGSIASFLSFQKKRIALIRGRAYENYVGIKKLIYSYFDKISLLFSHDVFFISHSLKTKYLEEKLLKKSKAYVINKGSSNGVDIHKFYPNKKENNKKFNILMIGRICKDKGFFELESILEKIKDLPIIFNIVGKVEDLESQNILNHLLKKYSFISYNQHTTNPVTYFQEADLHLFLSHREGFGNVAIEAASCGVPTFAYDVIGVQDSVQNNTSGLKFKFKDTDKIASSIRYYILNPSEYKEKFSNARNWVIENFEQKSVWNNYMQAYIKLLETK